MNPWRSAHRLSRVRQAILAWLFPLGGTVILLIAVIVAIVWSRG